MKNPVDNYWQVRLLIVKAALEKNGFDVHMAESCSQARSLVMDKIINDLDIQQVSRGGSITAQATVIDALKSSDRFDFIDPFERGISPEAREGLMRKALLSDLFVTGTNAITEDGKLVNLDALGNRVAAITFGPKFVLILSGRNKIVPDVDAAMDRIKRYAAPANAMKLGKQTPCVKTAQCMACESPDRICNTWTIAEKSKPPGRIKIILINEDLGL